MQLSRIEAFFHENISFGEFKNDIGEEVSRYKIALDKKGGSSSIFLDQDINVLYLQRRDVKYICDAFLRGQFDKWEINYLAEALMLSQKVEFLDDATKDALFDLADPEFFRLISVDYVEAIIRKYLMDDND
jgi:hypothetical protein